MVSLALLGVASADTLIVLNKAARSATFLDRATGEELATLKTAAGPHEVVVSPDGKIAVGAEYGVRGQPGGSLVVFDLDGRRILKRIKLGEYTRPHGIEFLPRSRKLVVTAEAQKKLLVVDIDSGKIEAAIDTGQNASHMVALSPKGDRAYVANIASGSITVIDLVKQERIRIVPTGRGAEGIAVSPDGTQVWVTNRAADTISVVDTEKLEVVVHLACAGFPIRIKFTPDGRRVLVSCAFSGELVIFDVKERKQIKRLSLARKDRRDKGNMFRRRGPLPVGIVVAPDGKQAFVACGNYDALAVIDLKTLTVSGHFETGREPDGVAYSAK